MGREWPGVDLLLRTLLQVGGIVEFATNLREVSQCLEKAPKIANNKEKVLTIETPCTANKTMP